MAYPIYARDVGEIFFSVFFFAKFLNKVWEKDYFGYMKGSKFIAVLFIWNTKLGIAMNCSYREGDILSMLVRFFNGIAG